MVEVRSSLIRIGPPAFDAGPVDDPGLLFRIGDDLGRRGEVGLHSLLEVEGHVGIRLEIGDPVPGKPRPTGQVELAVEVVEIDFYATRLATLATCGGYVDDPAPTEGLFDCSIHAGRNPVTGVGIPG